jgi:hypothetical protein
MTTCGHSARYSRRSGLRSTRLPRATRCSRRSSPASGRSRIDHAIPMGLFVARAVGMEPFMELRVDSVGELLCRMLEERQAGTKWRYYRNDLLVPQGMTFVYAHDALRKMWGDSPGNPDPPTAQAYRRLAAAERDERDAVLRAALNRVDDALDDLRACTRRDMLSRQLVFSNTSTFCSLASTSLSRRPTRVTANGRTRSTTPSVRPSSRPGLRSNCLPRKSTVRPLRWSTYGAERTQRAANRRRAAEPERDSAKPIPSPTIAGSCAHNEIVRRGRRFESVRGLCKSAARRHFSFSSTCSESNVRYVWSRFMELWCSRA